MANTDPLMEQYLRLGAISKEESLALEKHGDELAGIQACSGELYTMAFEKYFSGKSGDKERARYLYARLRDIASRLPKEIDASSEISECRMDLAYIMSEGDKPDAYSLRLGRDIRAGKPFRIKTPDMQ